MEMKKYMTPEMEIVDVKLQNTLLAGSINVGGDDNPPIGTEPGNGDDQI